MDLSTLLTTDMDPRSHAAASMLLLQAGGPTSTPSTDCDSGTSSDGTRTPRSVQVPPRSSAPAPASDGGGCGGGGHAFNLSATGGLGYTHAHGHSHAHAHTHHARAYGGVLGGGAGGGAPIELGAFSPAPPPAGDAGGGAAGGDLPAAPPPSRGGSSSPGGGGGDPGGCCYICGTYFTRKTNVEKHLTTRHGVGIAQASFPCEVCGVSFLLMEYTRRHEKNIHHHKRQYRCGICRKMCFGFRSKLVEHLRTAHGGKGVVCAACGCAFKDVTLLERHYKRKHARTADA
ncbi:hypothetical protein I4F81_002402 [Pyropia yezoensis]|uniref:Uncharacterized protein n=1 Tax=Pyropia yezoensis TaxID=2788 RepID=A0ACC3BPG7_PYRYE|nr:hypothetical protein I4F81_002402 [Neopyropia yezoensis]